MNKRLKLLAIIIVLPVSVAVPVILAQTIASDSHVYAQQSTLQQRVDAYKAKLGTSPSQSELNRLKLRCSVAQTVFKNLQTHTTDVQKNRNTVYEGISKDLTDLQAALKAKSVDITKLDAQMKELTTKTTQFKTDMETYTQAVADSGAVDCATDPLALKAALQEARTAHDKLVIEIADIRTSINNTIKPTLTQVKTDLQAQAAAKAATPATPTTPTQGATN